MQLAYKLLMFNELQTIHQDRIEYRVALIRPANEQIRVEHSNQADTHNDL